VCGGDLIALSAKRTIIARAPTPPVRLGLAAVALAAVLGVMATGIVVSYGQTRDQILTRFEARATTSAGFLSTYVSQQASRQRVAAQLLLAGRSGFPAALDTLATSFGAVSAGLVGPSGRLLDVFPYNRKYVGTRAAAQLPYIRQARATGIGVSGVYRSLAQDRPIVAVAVRFATPAGLRISAVGYPVSGSVLAAFVSHTIAPKQLHRVVLVDASGSIISASPRASARTLKTASPPLAQGLARSWAGAVEVDHQPGRFVASHVAGTPWRLVIAEPDSTLFASIGGTAQWLPWAVFGVISLLALAVLALFWRTLNARADALEASRLKSEFVASMSHELRTPLNGVVGMTGLLRNTELDDVQERYVSALAVSSEALLGVIGDVLDFSKLESGHLELDRTHFDLRDAVEEATLMLADRAHAKGLQIGHWVDVGVPVRVDGDRARLRQVLLNLLSNAVKFTMSGEVTLRVASDGGDQLHFSVTDTGIGIDEAQTEVLFEAFTQAEQSTNRRYGGTGLGLAISRRLVELMGGEIGAAPGERGGSVFWFTAAMPAVSGYAAAAQGRTDLQARRILIVDDSATNRTILEHYLRGWGVACESVDGASSAFEALARASREGHPFELAVLDFHMPEMNGIELAREIRKSPALGALRIVMLSSSSLGQQDLDGLGVSATLTKPARQVAIYDAITGALTGQGALPAPKRVKKRSSERGQTVLLAEDNEINRMLAEVLLGDLGLETEVASHGREAIEMAAARQYEAIFMDCQMPVVDGFEATREIRAAEVGRRVPIIAMTALSMPGDRERCLAAGADDYLTKPIRLEELEAIVERWLPLVAAGPPRVATVDAGVAGVVDEEAQAADGVLDRAAVMLIRERLSPEKRTQLIDTFDAQQAKCVGEIGGAIERGDRAEVRLVAHKLKGSSASLGAIRLRDRCQELELGGDEVELGAPQIAELRVVAAEARDALRHELIR